MATLEILDYTGRCGIWFQADKDVAEKLTAKYKKYWQDEDGLEALDKSGIRWFIALDTAEHTRDLLSDMVVEIVKQPYYADKLAVANMPKPVRPVILSEVIENSNNTGITCVVLFCDPEMVGKLSQFGQIYKSADSNLSGDRHRLFISPRYDVQEVLDYLKELAG